MTTNGMDMQTDDSADELGQKYYGKYRGVVFDNVDPMQIGRIQAIVPDVSALLPSTWAMPCVPVAGLQMGIYAVPPIDAGVWIEFEQGDPDYPIWVGCYWGTAGELPPLAKQTPPSIAAITLQTTRQNGLTISDAPGHNGGILLKSAAGASLLVSDTGIFIDTGRGAKISLTDNSVTINNDAFKVT
jgi:uncharacterized protein involved in type VI secretion and phage assembly